MRRIGRYKVLGELGRGSMGAVYKARDTEIGRIVAIKIIPTTNLPPEELEQYKQRFRREAQAAGGLSHPGIVTVHDIAEDEAGQPYIVMEFVEGKPLDKLLPPGTERLSLAQTLEIGVQVAQALDYAHRHGVVHRDIKPANILLTSDGRAKIADFGIAKLAGTQLTQTGQLLGTPAFMSPEQFSGAAVDTRSDIFSLGATLYWLCTGEKPFAGDTLTTISFKIVYTAPLPARQFNSALPADLDAVLACCMAKNPDHRYASCADLAADLKAIEAGRPVAAKPAPAAPVERTVVAPAMKTVPTGAVPGAEAAALEDAAIGATAKPAARRVKRGKWRRKLVAATTLVLLLGAGYWVWSTRALGLPAAGSAPTSEEAGAAGHSARRTGSPALSRASGRSRGRGDESDAQTRPVPSSTLRIVCEHNFESGRLEIFSDDDRLLETGLRGQERDYGVVRVFQGRLETSAALPAGRHVVRVHVRSPEEDYEDEAEITGAFVEGGARTLLIQFGKGSALGVTNRRLTLSWR